MTNKILISRSTYGDALRSLMSHECVDRVLQSPKIPLVESAAGDFINIDNARAFVYQLFDQALSKSFAIQIPDNTLYDARIAFKNLKSAISKSQNTSFPLRPLPSNWENDFSNAISKYIKAQETHHNQAKDKNSSRTGRPKGWKYSVFAIIVEGFEALYGREAATVGPTNRFAETFFKEGRAALERGEFENSEAGEHFLNLWLIPGEESVRNGLRRASDVGMRGVVESPKD